MPTIHVDAEISTRDLLQAVAQLGPTELEKFVAEVLALRAQRMPSEADLLQRIRQPVPEKVRRRYHDLIAKRRAGAITPEEHAELLRLTDQVENGDAERVRALGELARLRNRSLADVMQDLGIESPTHE